jgi:hypothetical protein
VNGGGSQQLQLDQWQPAPRAHFQILPSAVLKSLRDPSPEANQLVGSPREQLYNLSAVACAVQAQLPWKSRWRLKLKIAN